MRRLRRPCHGGGGDRRCDQRFVDRCDLAQGFVQQASRVGGGRKCTVDQSAHGCGIDGRVGLEHLITILGDGFGDHATGLEQLAFHLGQRLCGDMFGALRLAQPSADIIEFGPQSIGFGHQRGLCSVLALQIGG